GEPAPAPGGATGPAAGRSAARRPPDLRRARRAGAAAGAAGAAALAGRRGDRGGQPLEHPGAARRPDQRRPLGADQDRGAGARREEVPERAAERALRRLHRAVDGQRLRDGLRLLLRPAPQGLQQPGHDVREHRADHALPRPAHHPAGHQEHAEPVRPDRLALRHRREQRLLRRRHHQRQRGRPRGAVPPAAHRQGQLRHQVRQPRSARARPPGPDPGPLLADARGDGQAGRHPHLPGRGADRGHRRLRRRRVRGAPQLLPGRRGRRLAGAVDRALRAGQRRRGGDGPPAAGRRDHLPHPQRAAARGQPGLAPEGRGGALAPRPAGDQTLGERRPQRPVPQRGQAGLPRPAAGRAGADPARVHRPVRVL
ncbi:MAG: Spore photoproduct lyase, partial [uncultured Friedmanniella sp.]